MQSTNRNFSLFWDQPLCLFHLTEKGDQRYLRGTFLLAIIDLKPWCVHAFKSPWAPHMLSSCFFNKSTVKPKRKDLLSITEVRHACATITQFQIHWMISINKIVGISIQNKSTWKAFHHFSQSGHYKLVQLEKLVIDKLIPNRMYKGLVLSQQIDNAHSI